MWFEDGHKINVYHSPAPDDNHPQGEIYKLVEDPNEMANLWGLDRVQGLKARAENASGDRFTDG